MKVVQELVNYFDRQGKLSPKQLRKLLEQGFLAADAPATMHGLCDTVGTSFYFRVIGQIDGQLWGTDVYTGDSSICTAAVHAGVITLDRGGLVTVELRPGQSAYKGTTRNGVTSTEYGAYTHSFLVR